jgi:hypothetical protein
MFAESWHVRSRARECAATAQAFAEGDDVVTALHPDPESSGYLRRDYLLNAWESLPEEERRAFSFWRSVYTPPPREGREDPAEKLSAEELLRRLVEEDAGHTENTRYILAVMLERQKLLRETDCQRTPSSILRVYEHRKTGEVFIIRDPDILLDRVESVQAEVALMLEHQGRPPEASAVADPDTATEAAATQEPDASQPDPS